MLSTYSARNSSEWHPSDRIRPFSLHAPDPRVSSINLLTVEVFDTNIVTIVVVVIIIICCCCRYSHSWQAQPFSPRWWVPCFVSVFSFPNAQEKWPLSQLQGGGSWPVLIYPAHSIPTAPRIGLGMCLSLICHHKCWVTLISKVPYCEAWDKKHHCSLGEFITYLVKDTCVHENMIDYESAIVLNGK